MKFRQLTKREFEQFALNHPQSNFFQSLYMKELLEAENREVYLVGLVDNHQVIAASLLATSGSFLHKKTFEALKGFLIDYNNFKLLDYFVLKVKEFVKAHGGFRLIIDPYIVYVQRDSEANVVENGSDNTHILKHLMDIGFVKVENSVQVQYTYVLDIDHQTSEQLFSHFKPNTRNYINRTLNKYKLVIEQLEYEDLKYFKQITADTCARRGFADRSLEYYQNMYKIFKDKLKVLVCKLDTKLYLQTLQDQKQELENKINNLSDSSSNKKKKEVMKNDIRNIDKKVQEVNNLKQTNGRYVYLSGAMFVLYGSEVVYLFSGSYDEYMKYCGQYALQWEMIKYASEHHYQRYNFYGIKDVFDKQGKDYGVYEFKKGFNGYVEQLLGAYEIGVSSLYNVYNFLKKIKKKFKN